MLRLFVALVTLVTMLMTGAVVLAQGVITDYYTPPMQASDTLFLPIDIHNEAPNPPWAGWAGGRMEMHLAPTGEIDVLGLTPVASGPGSRGPGGAGVPTGPTIVSPFGPQSNNVASQVLTFFAIHPAAQASGINISPSVNQPLFDLNIHIKNSNPTGNGNTDATFKFWNIWHVRETPGSTFVHLDPSDYILVNSSIQDPQQLHTPGSQWLFPTNPATINDPNAHWLHLIEPADFHLFGFGSQFYATALNTALLHIEHVPEPTGIVLLSAGMACTVAGAVMRRRRRKLAA